MKLLGKFLPKKEKYVNLSDIYNDIEEKMDEAWENEEKMESMYNESFVLEWNGMKVIIPFGATVYNEMTRALKLMIDDGCVEEDVLAEYESRGIRYGN